MNKYQEALDDVTADLNRLSSIGWHLHTNADDIEILQKLVDKATGQKKHIKNCKEREYINHNYCYACGQKLDWSDID